MHCIWDRQCNYNVTPLQCKLHRLFSLPPPPFPLCSTARQLSTLGPLIFPAGSGLVCCGRMAMRAQRESGRVRQCVCVHKQGRVDRSGPRVVRGFMCATRSADKEEDPADCLPTWTASLVWTQQAGRAENPAVNPQFLLDWQNNGRGCRVFWKI